MCAETHTSFLAWGSASGTGSACCLSMPLCSGGWHYGLRTEQGPEGQPKAALRSCEVAQMCGWQKWHGQDRQSASPRGGANFDEPESSLRPGTAAPAVGSPVPGNRPGGRAAFAPSPRHCSSESRQTRGPNCPTCLGFPRCYPQVHRFALLSSGEPVDTTDWLRNKNSHCNTRRALISFLRHSLCSHKWNWMKWEVTHLIHSLSNSCLFCQCRRRSPIVTNHSDQKYFLDNLDRNRFSLVLSNGKHCIMQSLNTKRLKTIIILATTGSKVIFGDKLGSTDTDCSLMPQQWRLLVVAIVFQELPFNAELFRKAIT